MLFKGYPLSILALIVVYCTLTEAYNYPPENEPDCAEICELQIIQCTYEEHCDNDVACETRCHTIGSRCYGHCILRLVNEGKFEMPRRPNRDSNGSK